MTKEALLSQFKSLQVMLENLETANPPQETHQLAREALLVAESLQQDCETELDGLAVQIQEVLQARHTFTSHVSTSCARRDLHPRLYGPAEAGDYRPGERAAAEFLKYYQE
jgi:hypothetical protein